MIKRIPLLFIILVGAAFLLLFGFFRAVSPEKDFFDPKFHPSSHANRSEIERFRALADREGVASAYQTFKEEYRGREQEGHMIAHEFGALLYERGESPLAVCDERFQHGCSMGFAVEFARAEGPKEARSLESRCMNGLGSGLRALSCAHGAGHGLLLFAHADTEAALEACDGFSGSHLKHFCYSGTFMELFHGTVSGTGVLTPEGALGGLWDFCAGLSGSYASLCAVELGKEVLGAGGGSVSRRIEEVCARPASAAVGEGCAFGVGFSYVSADPRAERELLEASCGDAFSDRRLGANCRVGVAAGLVWHQRPREDAEAVCATAFGLETRCRELIEARKRLREDALNEGRGR